MFEKITATLAKLFAPVGRWFRSVLRLPHKGHIKLFVFSLMLSVALWCFVSYDNHAKAIRTVSVPVQYTGLARGLDKRSNIGAVRVKLMGKEKALLKLTPEDIDATVDLRGKGVGTYTLDIDATTSTAGVKVAMVYPIRTKVSIFQVSKKVLPIKINLINKVEGQNISDIILTPSQIAVTGKRDALKAIKVLNVSLDTKKLDSDGNVTLPITIPDLPEQFQEGSDYTLSQDNVTAHVVFGNEIVTRELPLAYTLVGKPKSGVEIIRIISFPSRVKVKARASFFNKIRQINVGKVDVAGISETTVLEVPFVVSEGFKRLHPGVEFDAPSKIRLDIVCRELAARKFYESVPIKFVGQVAPGATISNRSASVTVETTESLLNGFRGEVPFEIYVDMTNIVQKKVTLPISFKARKAGVKLINITPNVVTIEQK